ncbi:hypothetical protein GCM10022222_52040 [Amycolatopsis ultiminotia]|uniref:NAD(P)-binding domain-containing protein n=1 Tax=Amycolatopsis ultiminotia TaxID=543629 RepID=A0ABP6X5P0_9PSEU
MTEQSEETLPVVVLGGTGRVGSAVINELTARRRPVVAVSRHRATAQDMPLVTSRAGDVHDLREALRGIQAAAVVIAVTPFTAPPESFASFDTDFYTHIVNQLQVLLPAGTRVIDVAVTAIAYLEDGSTVSDHEELFPARLRPFSRAHARGADRLGISPLNGTVLIPAAGLGVQDSTTVSQPTLLSEPVSVEDVTAAVDHAALARAVADQLAVTTPGAPRLLVRTA